MFNDMNDCKFSGRLGADPEIRTFSNGNKVANLRLAVSQSWKDKASGERKESTEWVSVQVFVDGLVGLVERFTRKGSRLLVGGKMKTRKWQDQSGNDKYSTEIILQGFDSFIQLLDDKQGGQSDGNSHQNSDGFQGSGGGGAFDPDLDDSVPFATSDFAFERKRREVL
jgi:single-strand DNA-binding protein